MSLLLNKPHVWVKKNSGYDQLKIYVNCDPGVGISLDTNMYWEEEDGDTLQVHFRLHSSGSFSRTLEYELGPATNSIYDPEEHKTVKVVISDWNSLGHHSVRPISGDFSTDGATPHPEPWIWLQAISASTFSAHIQALIPENSTFENIEINDDFETLTRRVTYNFKNVNPGEMRFIHLDHMMNDSTSYDPSLISAIFEVVITESSGEKRKGTGTVHTSEADAS